MTGVMDIDHWARGFRGPLIAALLALLAALPGALLTPPIDRDESRFAEATAQMLETRDFVRIRFQDEARNKKPVGIHWLQAAAVAAVSDVETRAIWAWRMPSLLGVMLAAGACVWGGAACLRPGSALSAGTLLACSFMLSTEGQIAATDAVLAGATTLTLAALLRLRLAADGRVHAGRGVRIALWAGLILGVMVKGPITPMIFALTLIALGLWERRWLWMRGLGWGWGLIALLAVAGPWALAITVATDGDFWTGAVGHDLASKLAGGSEGHAAPPGYYLLLTPLLVFPATLLLPAAGAVALRLRAEPLVRFALCALGPSWLIFELTPTKLIHYALPLYGVLAWLMTRALDARDAKGAPPMARDRGLQAGGAALGIVAALAFAGAPFAAMLRLHDWTPLPFAVISSLLAVIAAGVGAGFTAAGHARRGAVAASLLAAVSHAALAGGVAPDLKGLWVSDRAARVLAGAGASPWQGVVPGPVAVVGYAEPSLIFALGADTELTDAAGAVEALGQGRPAIVELKHDAAFREGLARNHLRARLAGEVDGLDYSTGRQVSLRVWRPPRARGHRRTP